MKTRVLPGQKVFNIPKTISPVLDITLPKAVADARKTVEDTKAFKEGDVPALADALKANLVAKQYNSLGATFRARMNDNTKEAYHQLDKDRERREMIATFVLDPACCTSIEGYNKTFKYSEKKEQEREVWITEAQMAGSEFMNSKEHAKLFCDSMKGTTQERPHEQPVFAKAGIMQYHWTDSQTIKTVGDRQENDTNATSDLTAEEYQEVHAELTKSPGASSTKKRRTTSKPKVAKSPEEIMMDEATQEKNIVWRKTKTTLDKCTSDACSVIDDIKKLHPDRLPMAFG